MRELMCCRERTLWYVPEARLRHHDDHLEGSQVVQDVLRPFADAISRGHKRFEPLDPR